MSERKLEEATYSFFDEGNVVEVDFFDRRGEGYVEVAATEEGVAIGGNRFSLSAFNDELKRHGLTTTAGSRGKPFWSKIRVEKIDEQEVDAADTRDENGGESRDE